MKAECKKVTSVLIFMYDFVVSATRNWPLDRPEVGVSVACPNQRVDLRLKNHRNRHFLLSAILCQLQRNIFQLSLVGGFSFSVTGDGRFFFFVSKC